MAPEDQTRDQNARRSAFSTTDTCSIVSTTSSDSYEENLASDGDDDDKGGHVNLVMSDLLNHPPPASVSISNSTDVRIGPSLNYNGPVTINQYLNLQQHTDGVGGLANVNLPQALLSDGEGKCVLSGVTSSGVGAGAEASKRVGGDSAGAGGAPWWRQPKVLAAAGTLVVLMAVVGTTLALLWPDAGVGGDQNSRKKSLPLTPPESPPGPDFLLENGRQIIRASKWSSVPPKYIRKLLHPTPYVVIGHTVGSACEGELECFPILCTYRDEHRSTWQQPDISYNFLIDVAGNIYEGRGWDATNNYQPHVARCNLGVALMGNFMNDNVTQAMELSLQQLLQLGVSRGKLDPDYRLLAHSQLMPTLSPGSNVLKVIDKWPHRCLSQCFAGVECKTSPNVTLLDSQ